MTSVIFMHADPQAKVFANPQADGYPVLKLATDRADLNLFAPSARIFGPDEHLAFAEALASAANEFLALARQYVAEQRWCHEEPAAAGVAHHLAQPQRG